MTRKLDVVHETKAGDVSHDVVSAIGTKRAEPGLLEHRQKQIATRAIFALQTVVVFLWQRQRIGAGRLQRRCGPDSEKVMNLANRAGDLRRRDAVTHAPTRN